MLDSPPLTWKEWNKTKPEKQFDRNKFTALSIVEKDKRIRNMINELVDNILNVSDPVKILLFGSRARGDYRKNSDIDILVIFKRKRDITRKYYNMISNLVKTSPVDVDFKTDSMQQIKNYRENMDDVYYYIMHDAIILYQHGDNGLYNFLENARMFLYFSRNYPESKTASGLEPYLSIKRSLGSVFLAGHRAMPTNMSSLQKIAKQLPNDWKVKKLCNNDELNRLTRVVKITPGLHSDKNPTESYVVAKKIYESVLEECIERKLLCLDKIEELHRYCDNV